MPTIEIDDDALARLDGHRGAGRTPSEVIRRYVPEPSQPPLPPNAVPRERPLPTREDWLALMERMTRNPMSDEAIAAVEQVIADRQLPINKRDRWAEALAEEAQEAESESGR